MPAVRQFNKSDFAYYLQVIALAKTMTETHNSLAF